MLLLVDLDGVVYRGRVPVPGMADVLGRRAADGDRVIYVTNNSRAHRDEYRARLAEMGVPLDGESIVTAARATALLLAEMEPVPGRVLVLGGPGLAREIRDAGMRTVAPTERGLASQPEAVAVGVDFRLSYSRLSVTAEAVRRGARFVATNRDPVFPAADRLTAGAGAIVAAVEAAAGRPPDVVVGKPQPLLFETAAQLAGLPVHEAVVIGDNLLTDIAAARGVGARSVLILTGVTTREEVEAAAPDARPSAVARDAAHLEDVLQDMARG